MKSMHRTLPMPVQSILLGKGSSLSPAPLSCWLRLVHCLLYSVVISLWFTLGTGFFICLFTHHILDFKIWWKCVLMMGVFSRLVAMFKIFMMSLNLTRWTTIPFVLEASWCEKKCLLCFLVIACSDTGQSLIKGGYDTKFSSCKALDPSRLLFVVFYCWL